MMVRPPVLLRGRKRWYQRHRVLLLCAPPCLSKPNVLATRHVYGRYDLFEPSGHSTAIPEVVCSNGVHGVEQDSSCCAAECGTCGGSGCGQRSRGQVCWYTLSSLAFDGWYDRNVTFFYQASYDCKGPSTEKASNIVGTPVEAIQYISLSVLP